jgi:hypothetical protein
MKPRGYPIPLSDILLVPFFTLAVVGLTGLKLVSLIF